MSNLTVQTRGRGLGRGGKGVDNSQKSLSSFVQDGKDKLKSTSLNGSSSESKLDRILEQTSKLEELVHDVAELKVQFGKIGKLVEDTVKQELIVSDRWWENRHSLLSKRIDKLEEKEEREERQKRKNNIIVKGIDFATGNAEAMISDVLKNELGLEDVVILNTEVITARNGVKMAVVKLKSLENKKEVMKSKKRLAGSQISISPDYTVKEQRCQRKLRQLAEDLKKEGKRASVVYNGLFVDGVKMVLDDAGELTMAKMNGITEASQVGHGPLSQRSS